MGNEEWGVGGQGRASPLTHCQLSIPHSPAHGHLYPNQCSDCTYSSRQCRRAHGVIVMIDNASKMFVRSAQARANARIVLTNRRGCAVARSERTQGHRRSIPVKSGYLTP